MMRRSNSRIPSLLHSVFQYLLPVAEKEIAKLGPFVSANHLVLLPIYIFYISFEQNDWHKFSFYTLIFLKGSLMTMYWWYGIILQCLIWYFNNSLWIIEISLSLLFASDYIAFTCDKRRMCTMTYVFICHIRGLPDINKMRLLNVAFSWSICKYALLNFFISFAVYTILYNFLIWSDNLVNADVKVKCFVNLQNICDQDKSLNVGDLHRYVCIIFSLTFEMELTLSTLISFWVNIQYMCSFSNFYTPR